MRAYCANLGTHSHHTTNAATCSRAEDVISSFGKQTKLYVNNRNEHRAPEGTGDGSALEQISFVLSRLHSLLGTVYPAVANSSQTHIPEPKSLKHNFVLIRSNVDFL